MSNEVVGRIAINNGWAGTIIEIIPTAKTPNFRVRWVNGQETVVTARGIRLAAEMPAVNAAQLPNQAALANAAEDESGRDNSGIESESSSDSESDASDEM